jgi:succinate-semialdehyde dehydrogenase/glutarate-semialdehyde dehydrogenase
MSFTTRNPATGETLRTHPAFDDARLEQALEASAAAFPVWRATAVAERAACLVRAAEVLRAGSDRYAALMTAEMGKPIRESRAEVEKGALGCEFYARNAETFLRDEPGDSDALFSRVAFHPLGTVLAIMPWNFPLWQVLRFALPALVAGNGVLLKPAPGTLGCGLALEAIWREAGLPEGVFQTLPIGHEQAENLIADPRVHAVTLTGSERAGRRIATLAGAALKKAVLELGGSDPFVVLEDADLDRAVATAVAARFQNTGQSCIAAKRFILVEPVADAFLERFRRRVESLVVGDPTREDTDLGPLARADLRDNLHRQVTESIALGAVPVTGCAPVEGPGFFYRPSILDRVRPGLPAYDEELFGPVAAIVRVKDESEALAVANRHRYGLGASVWTADRERGERLARRFEAGVAFVNGLVKSDPRLPFGGVKNSGYGRELGVYGIREFVNIQTVCVY